MKYIRVSIFIILAFILTACGGFTSPAPPSSPAPVTNPTATPGPDPYERQPEVTPPRDPDAGILSLSMRPPLTLNPLLNTDATVDTILKLIYEPLVVLDGALKPVANLASYVFSSDYTSANLTLRDDAMWSDGTPVTSADIIYTVGVLQNAPDDVIYKKCAVNIASCEIVSDKTVKLTFTQIYGGQPYMLTFPLIPAHLKDGISTTPVGNGLYLYGGDVSGDRVKLTASPYTFHRQARIETVEVMLVPDRQTERHAFNQGLVDAITITLYDWISQKSTKAVRYGEHPAMYFDFVGFNFTHPLLKQLEFRQAVAACMDFDAAAAEIYLDHALRAATPINPASWLSINAPLPGYDAEAARRLLQSALDKAADVTNIRILANSEDSERVKIAERLADALTDAGLAAYAEALPFEEFTMKLASGEFEIIVGGYNLSAVPDLRFAFHSSEIETGGNFLRYDSDRMDELLGAVNGAFSEREYMRAAAELQRYFAEDLPVISLVFRNAAVITDERVKGEIKPAFGSPYANINEWELD